MSFARLLLFTSLAVFAAGAGAPAPASFCYGFQFKDDCTTSHTEGECMWCRLSDSYDISQLHSCVPYNAGGCCAAAGGRGSCEVHQDPVNTSLTCKWCGTFSQSPCVNAGDACPQPEDCYVAQTPRECQMRTDAHNLTCAWCGDYGCVNYGDCHIDHEWPIMPAYGNSWVASPCSIGNGEDAVVAVRTNHSSSFVAIWEVLITVGALKYVRLSDLLVPMPDPVEIPQANGTFVYEFHIPATNTLTPSGFIWSQFFTNTSQWQLTLRAFDKKVKTWSNTTVIQVNGTQCNVATFCSNITDYRVCGGRSDCLWCGQLCVDPKSDSCPVQLSNFDAFWRSGNATCPGSSSMASSGYYAWLLDPSGYPSVYNTFIVQMPSFWYNVSWFDTMPSNKTTMHLRVWPHDETNNAPDTTSGAVADMSFWIFHPAPGSYQMQAWLYDFQVVLPTTKYWAEIYWENACPQVQLLLPRTDSSQAATWKYPEPVFESGFDWTALSGTYPPLMKGDSKENGITYESAGYTPCYDWECDYNTLFCDKCDCPGNGINYDGTSKCVPDGSLTLRSCTFEVINSSMDHTDATLVNATTIPLSETHSKANSTMWCQELLHTWYSDASWYTLEIDSREKWARCTIYTTTDHKLRRGIACDPAWPHCETGIADCARTLVVQSAGDKELVIHPGTSTGTSTTSEKIVDNVLSSDECISVCSNFVNCVAWEWRPDSNLCLVSGLSSSTAKKGVPQFLKGTNKANIVSGVMNPEGCDSTTAGCYDGTCYGRRVGEGTCHCPSANSQSLEQPPLLNVHYNWVTNKISFDVIVPQTYPARIVSTVTLGSLTYTFPSTVVVSDPPSCLIPIRNVFGEFDVATLVTNTTLGCSLDSTDADNYRYRCVVSVSYSDSTLGVTVPLPFSIIAPLKPNVTIGMHHMGVKTLWAYVSKSKATFDAFGNATFLIEITTLAPIYSVIEPDSITFDKLGKVTGVELLNYTDVKHNQQLASWNLSITVGSSVCTLTEDDGVMMNFKLNHSTTGVEPHAIKLTIGSFESLCSVTTGVEDNFQNFLFFSDFPDLGKNSSASQGAYNGLFFPNNTIYAGVYLALPWAPRVWPNVTITAALAHGDGVIKDASAIPHQIDLMPYLHPMPCPVPTMAEYNYQKNLVVCFGLEIMKGYYIPDSEIKVDVTLVIINTTMLPEVYANTKKRTTAEFAIQGTFKLARAPTAEMRMPEIAPETPKPLAQQQPQVRIVYRTPFAAYATMLVVALASGWCLAALASYLYNRSRSSSAMLL